MENPPRFDPIWAVLDVWRLSHNGTEARMLGCSHLCPSSIWGYTTRRLPLDVSMKSYAAWLAHWPQRDHYTIQQSTYITIWVTIGNPNVSVWLSPVPGVTADSETDSVHIRPHKRKHKQSGIHLNLQRDAKGTLETHAQWWEQLQHQAHLQQRPTICSHLEEILVLFGHFHN